MAQTGYTPILIYASGTTGNTPSASNLTSSSAGAELALNYFDGKLFYKDASGNVQVLAGKGGTGVVAGSNTQVQYNNNGVFGASANMVFNGTRLTVADLADSSLTSGRVTYATTGGNLTDSASLTFDGTTFRATAGRSQFAGSAAPSTGSGLELGSDGTSSFLVSYNRGSTAYMPMIFDASFEAWQINGTEGMRLTSTGLGIGTSSPSQRLQVVGNALFGGAGTYQTVFVNNNSATGGGAFAVQQNGVTSGFYAISGGWLGDTSSDLAIAAIAPNIRFYTNNSTTERMRLDNAGNLGLGVTPSAWNSAYKALQVSPRAAITGDSAQSIFSHNLVISATGDRYIGNGFASLYTQLNGQHVFFTAPSGTAGNAISFTQAMTLDASGNLVIGNTSATAAFDVYRASDAYMCLRTGSAEMTFNTGTGFTGSTATSIWNKSAIPMVFGTNYVERARITSGGDLLVGTTSAFAKLTVSRGGSDGNGLFVSNNAGSLIYQEFSGVSYFWNSNTTLFFGTNTSNPLVFGTNNGERMRITTGGYVGIGTSNPGTTLDVACGTNPGLRVDQRYTFGGGNYAISIPGDGSTVGYISQNPAAGGIVVADGMTYYGGGPWRPDGTSAESMQMLGGNIIFTANTGLTGGVNFTPTERARITSTGHLLVQRSSDSFVSTWGVLGLGNGSFLSGPTAGGDNNALLSANAYYDGSWKRANSGSTSLLEMLFGGTQVQFFTAGGGAANSAITWTSGPYIANGGTSWTNSSDAKLKNITGEIEEAVAKVMQIRAARYTWKSDPENKPQVGLIAQDLQKVLPEVVVVPPKEFDDYGRETSLGVNYDQVIPLLVAAIKEQQGMIDQLKARLGAANL